MNAERKGVYGIEKFYDEELTGTDGSVEGVKNPKNFWTIDAVKKKKSVSVQNGNNVILTIDSVLQYIFEPGSIFKPVQLQWGYSQRQ